MDILCAQRNGCTENTGSWPGTFCNQLIGKCGFGWLYRKFRALSSDSVYRWRKLNMKLQDALRKVIKLAGMGVIQDKRLLSFLS